MNAVRVVWTNDFNRVSGRGKPHFVPKLYSQQRTYDGHAVWQYTGMHMKPRRSERLALKDGRRLADCYSAFFGGVGPELHGRPVEIYPTLDGFVIDGDEEHLAEGW